MIDKTVEKMKKKIRKLDWYQKLNLMDWLNNWYSDYKEEQDRLLEEEYAEYKEDNCICKYDMNNVNCPECY